MTAPVPASAPVEVELKLALPTGDPSRLAQKLARLPLLSRRKSSPQQLRNINFDTPELHLHERSTALRLRHMQTATGAAWLQTLKAGERSDSALSQRGEWETPVQGAHLSLQALQGTPWSDLDSDGTLFKALVPVFEANFERHRWLVRRSDGSVVEVALDIGQIIADKRTAPICELKLELKIGSAAALFEVAQQIAQDIAVLPTSMSKAECGYALRQDSLGAPTDARTQPLRARQPLPEVMQQVLREAFSQFTSNLNRLLRSDDPEMVHQARVGWRRFKGAVSLFKPLLVPDAVPCWQALEVLLMCLGQLRDLDVAHTQTLPRLAHAYGANNPSKIQVWRDMLGALEEAACLQRKAVRYALQEPAVGACLLASTQWLESLTGGAASHRVTIETGTPTRPWVRDRIKRLHRQLKRSRKRAEQPEQQHRVRILAKRMRYNLAALQALLPRKISRRWLHQASKLQSRLGAARDAARVAALMAELNVDRSLIEFLTEVQETAL